MEQEQIFSMKKKAAARFSRLMKELETSRVHFRNAVENNIDGIVILDTHGVILYLNPAAEKIFGKAREEIVGKTFGIPEDLDRASEIDFRFHNMERGTAEMRAVETEWEGHDAILLSVRDISERKRAEREILELNEKLEEKVQKRTEQLEIANRELEAFNCTVSHDLRTPLARIDGYATLLIDDLEQQVDPEHIGYLRRIRASVGEMVELTNGLLQLSRIDRFQLQVQAVDLSAVAGRILEELRSREPARNTKIVLEPNLMAHGDLVLLRSALENLLSNAWKFTKNRNPAVIEIGSVPGENEAVFFVRDNGAGFAMNRADELFRVFHRLHNTSEFSGTGVGLSTAQRIIHRHGGRIWAKAETGKGATFFFTFGHHTADQ